MQTYSRSTTLPASAADAFAWHDRAGAFERLVPPWERVRLVHASGPLRAGETVELSVQLGPFSRRWLAELRDVEPGAAFTDVQVSGPFRSWSHRHRFEPRGRDRCLLVDEVRYELPLGILGRVANGLVRRKLDRLFSWRHAVTSSDLAAPRAAERNAAMKILITGASGLVGSALLPYLDTRGHAVLKAIRSEDGNRSGTVRWTPEQGLVESSELAGLHAVVHLAGENIAARRWSDGQMQRIRESRVEGTRRLCESVAKLAAPPQVLVCASAVGFYGDRGTETLTEESANGTGFLAGVSKEWEEATQPASDAGIRVVNLRFGVVLDPKGGALARMLTPFRMGVGGRIGSGRQLMSWISREDAIRVIEHALVDDRLEGPVNAVAPEPVTNKEFTRALGKVLGRPSFMPLPAWAARLALGRMADELLLASTGAVPKKLLESGFSFRHAELVATLAELLGRSAKISG